MGSWEPPHEVGVDDIPGDTLGEDVKASRDVMPLDQDSRITLAGVATGPHFVKQCKESSGS